MFKWPKPASYSKKIQVVGIPWIFKDILALKKAGNFKKFQDLFNYVKFCVYFALSQILTIHYSTMSQ